MQVVSSPSPIEAEVIQIRTLIKSMRYAEALTVAEALLTRVPENRDVLYMVAVSYRYLQRVSQALSSLAVLEVYHPGYSHLFQERGHCFAAMNDPAAALEAYLHAVNINPALPASWYALDILFRSAGRLAESEIAASHVAKLKGFHPAVVIASSLFADGETHEAERIIRAFLTDHPSDIEGMRLLARIGITLDVLDDAEFLLESVLVFSPTYQLARYDYVRVLLQRHRNVRALEEALILLDADPINRDYRAIYATACLALANYDEAIRVYQELLKEAPAAAELHLSIGHALKTLGRQQEAIASYRKAARVSPSFGDAYWSLANLKTYRFNDEEIDRMTTEEAHADISPTDRYHLCFALGKALEDRREYFESFNYYERGNQLKASEVKYKPEIVENNAEQQKLLFTSEFVSKRKGFGSDQSDPIFVVGLPRAGSTLIEQILASHSEVEGTMELADISRLVLRLQGRSQEANVDPYPGLLSSFSSNQLQLIGEKYIEDTRVYRTEKRRLFIDKNPNNFRHLGLIHLILPNARIIDARREPMACCFSNYKQLFASGQEFTYSLNDIGRYYTTYIDLMGHWESVFRDNILRVQHEDLVLDLEEHVRKILSFCGLGFEQRCVDFHETARSVRTASSEQVRQPIFQDGLDQWRNYDMWLTPLRQSLRTSLTA